MRHNQQRLLAASRLLVRRTVDALPVRCHLEISAHLHSYTHSHRRSRLLTYIKPLCLYTHHHFCKRQCVQLMLQRPELSSTVLLQGNRKTGYYEQLFIYVLVWAHGSMSDYEIVLCSDGFFFFFQSVMYRVLFPWTFCKVHQNKIHPHLFKHPVWSSSAREHMGLT